MSYYKWQLTLKYIEAAEHKKLSTHTINYCVKDILNVYPKLKYDNINNDDSIDRLSR